MALSQLKNTVKTLLYHSGYYKAKYKRSLSEPPRLLALMYHDIAPDGAVADDLFAHVRLYAKQIDAHLQTIGKLFRVMTIEDAVDEILEKGELREPTAAITFDDGYESFYRVAYPLLRKHGFPATVYIPTDWIEGSYRPWWLLLERLVQLAFSNSRSPQDVINDGRLQELKSSLGDVAGVDWIRVRGRIENNLRGLPQEEIDSWIRKLAKVVGVSLDSIRLDSQPMTWQQIAELDKQGIRFGAHTQSHCNLKHISDEQTREELLKSKEILQSHVESKVAGFAYPYGVDDERYRQMKSMLEECRFKYACTAKTGINTNKSDLYMLRRTTLPHSTSHPLLFRELVLDYSQDLGETG